MPVRAMLLSVLFSLSASANAGALLVKWVDPTPASDAYVASYAVEVTVAGVSVSVPPSLQTPELALVLDAQEGTEIAVRYRAVNVLLPDRPVHGAWSPWHVASRATQPGDQSPPTLLLYVR